MADQFTPQQRSLIMSRIRGKDTKPELVIRSLLHRMGFRFRLHRSDLPGTPDIVLPKFKKVIFVHGCFWHMHNCKRGRSFPRTNERFWTLKRQRNVARDRKNILKLRKLGWRAQVIWQCQLRNLAASQCLLDDVLPSPKKRSPKSSQSPSDDRYTP
jgi:DNA mismatch endonuclease (patch repair protein)